MVTATREDLDFIAEDENIFEREFSPDERERLAGKGMAMADGSYPIATKQDLSNAIQAVGRAKDRGATMAHIKKRAKAMGMTDMLPDDWKEEEAMESMLASLDETGLVEASEGQAVQVTIIKAGWSENGRYYSPDVLRQAIPMFEGALAYLDHPSRSEERERPNRSVKDIAGLFENVHQDPNGDLKASLRFLGRHAEEMMPLVKEAINGKLDIGVSINAAGRLKEGLAEGRKGQVVEEITSVVSADIVTKPAAGGKFERLVASMDWVEDILKQASFEDWRKYHPEHKEETVAEWTEQIQAAVEDAVKPFKEELDQAKRRETARGKLEASAIPKAIHADLLEALAILDEAGQDKAIEAEVGKLKKLNLRPVVKGAGQDAGNETPMSEEFVKPGETVWQYRDRIRGQTALLETKQQS